MSVPNNPPLPSPLPTIVESIRANRRDLARLITRIVDHRASDELAALYPFTGTAHIVGITGAPGTGKSSLVNALSAHYRKDGKTVGIIAVDPTSPFSGGAILGDRIRMRELSGDPGVFIRSMATRGALGGLAAATGDVVRALDAAGFDIILVETVGAGQSEVDIARTAHTTLVVEAPGLGDDVQAIKAGILEIADILVVNKADNPGLETTLRALRAMLDLGHRVERIVHHGKLLALGNLSSNSSTDANTLPDENSSWQPQIVQTIAPNMTGIADLANKIAEHRQYLQQSGTLKLREQANLDSEITERLRESLLAHLLNQTPLEVIERIMTQVTDRTLDPASAARELLKYST